jgi:hypothetical protein
LVTWTILAVINWCSTCKNDVVKSANPVRRARGRRGRACSLASWPTTRCASPSGTTATATTCTTPSTRAAARWWSSGRVGTHFRGLSDWLHGPCRLSSIEPCFDCKDNVVKSGANPKHWTHWAATYEAHRRGTPHHMQGKVFRDGALVAACTKPRHFTVGALVHDFAGLHRTFLL